MADAKHRKHPGPPKSELPCPLAFAAGLTSHRTPPRPFSAFLGEIQASWAFLRVEKILIWQMTKPKQTSRLSQVSIFLLLPSVSRFDHRAKYRQFAVNRAKSRLKK
jgi:hypothetical protein